MSRRNLVWCFLLTATLFTFAVGQEKSTDWKLYDVLVARVKNGDQSVDLRQLRLAYSESPKFRNGPDITTQKHAMTIALNGKEFAKAIQNADTVLAVNYVDMNAHFVEYLPIESRASQKGLTSTNLCCSRYCDRSRIRAMADTKHGVSGDRCARRVCCTPLHAYRPPEIKAYLHKDGHAYDQVKYDDPASKEEKTMYFGVDIPAKHGL